MNRHTALLVVAAFTLAVFSLAAGPYQLSQLGTFLCFAILALSLDLVWGYGGLLSFGQAAFFGLGAYLFALGLKRLEPAWTAPAMAAAVLLPGLVALVLGWLVFSRRIAGAQFAVVTLAVSLVAAQVAASWYDVTGGGNGISGIVWLDEPIQLYYVIAAAAIGTYLLARRLVDSPFGTVLIAIRDNETRAELLGYDTVRFKLIVFGCAGGLAGLAGALYAPQVGFVSPTLFGFLLSTEVVIWTAVGGRGTVIGPMLGAVAVSFGSSYLSELLRTYWLAAVGALFVFVVVTLPRGLAPLAARALDRLWSVGDARPRARLTAQVHANGVDRTAAGGWTGTAPMLRVSGLTKRLDGRLIVDDVTLAVHAGERRCVIGPNGAGKTTLFNLISGGLRPDAGTVQFCGRDVGRLPAWQIAASGVGRKFQTPSVFDSLTVAENVAVAGWSRVGGIRRLLFASPTVAVEAAVRTVLAATDLLSKLDAPAAALSHGERQALELAMVLAGRPRLLLLDEPTAGLGTEEGDEAARLIRDLSERAGVTLMVIEHDMGFVREMDGPVTVLHQGRVLAEGTMGSIERDAAVQAAFIGR